MQQAHEHEDNVLLEYEYALEARRAGKLSILPLLVQNEDRSRFKAFDTSVFPDAKHNCKWSIATTTVRETMQELFALNGVHIARDDDCVDKLPRIMEMLQDALGKHNVLPAAAKSLCNDGGVGSRSGDQGQVHIQGQDGSDRNNHLSKKRLLYLVRTSHR